MKLIRSQCDQVGGCFFQNVTSVLTAVINPQGRLLEFNQGVGRLFGLDPQGYQEAVDFTVFLVKPDFQELSSIIPVTPADDHSSPIVEGLITVGSESSGYHTLNGAFFTHPAGFLLVAEYDVTSMDQLNATVVQLNEELADKQRELVRVNRELQRREKQITEMMLTDTLTELPNRRHLKQFLEQAFSRVGRDGTPLAVAIADIDHFKGVNDSYGHDVGDEVLQHFSRRMADSVRGGDFVARQGGEEFALVYPDTTLDQAIAVTERIRELSIGRLSEKMDRDVTASFGVASYEPDLSIEEILKRADEALYQAKDQGRNRVVPWRIRFPDKTGSSR